MQNSNTSGNTGYGASSSGTGSGYGSSGNTGYASGVGSTGSTTASGYAPAVDQRLKELGAGAEHFSTKQTISESQATHPGQERTERIEKQGIEQPTQYVTQQRVEEQNVAPIRIKQQEVQHVQQNTVVQEQPVIVKKQEVQVQKEAPIQVTKHTTQHETLPTIERKELVIQPVESSQTHASQVSQQSVNQYNTRGDSLATGETEKRGLGAHIKQAAHDVKEKVRGVFHGSNDETITETKST